MNGLIPGFEEPCPGVFIFDFDARRWLADFARLCNAHRITGAPNSMNKYGAELRVSKRVREELDGLTRMVDSIRLTQYPDIGKLKKPYAFLVDYERGKQPSLAKHYDAGSDVTLNLCLGKNFTGGDLVFYGPARRTRFVVPQHPGRAIIHRGAHVHRALPVLDGHRTNLILWCEARKR